MTNKHKDLFLKFIIHSIKQSNLIGYRNLTMMKWKLFETIKEIGPELEKTFPLLIFAAWQDITKFFDEVHISGIAKVMQEFIKKDGGYPTREVTEILFRYFEANCKHDEESCEILKVMATDFLRQEALRRIIANSCHYTPNALFLIAKMEQESDTTKGGKPLDLSQHGNIFKKDVFMLILFAFHRINELKKTDRCFNCVGIIRDHLDWCFKQIAGNENEQIKSGNQYAVFIENLVSTFQDNANILVSFLKEMGKCEPLLNRAKVMFGNKLVDCYKSHFFERMQNCSRRSYSGILKEMCEARKECIDFVADGAHLFKKEVTDPIRRLHKGKRKFLSLMNLDHSNLLQENDDDDI